MRGTDERSGSLFSYVDPEDRVRRDHPLRPIREIASKFLAAVLAQPRVKRLLSSDHFSVDGTILKA